MARCNRTIAAVCWQTSVVSSEVNQGPTVDAVFDELRAMWPSIAIERLVVKWPADDDNLWFIRLANAASVQIETGIDGRPPFLIEGDEPNQRRHTSEVRETVDLIVEWLQVE